MPITITASRRFAAISSARRTPKGVSIIAQSIMLAGAPASTKIDVACSSIFSDSTLGITAASAPERAMA